jgi:hypothetical protein
MKPSVMLGYVTEKAKKGVFFVEVRLDKAKAHFIKNQSLLHKDGYIRLHAYLVESLATNIREYRTLRMCEFYGHAETIFNPKHALLRGATVGDQRHKNLGMMLKFIKLHG